MKLRNFAKESGDSEELAFKKLLIVSIASICCVCGVVWSAMYYFIFGAGTIAFLPFLFILIVGTAIVVSHALRNYIILVYAQITCILFISAFIQWCIGSMDQSGFVTAWSFLGPIGAVIFLSRKEAILWMLLFLGVLVVSAVSEPALMGQKYMVSNGLKTMFYIMNVGIAASIVFAASVWFVSTIKVQKQRVDESLASQQLAYKQLAEAQDQLVKSEKMAALGVVATRLSHEILNPLNFVNNYADLSDEMLADMVKSTNEEEKKQSMATLSSNLQKIKEQGKRAEAIVKQLQEHSRKGSAHEFFEEDTNQ